MVSTTDDKMSMIMDRLERHGLRDNTIVIFMSDNGHSEENYKIRGKNHTSGLAEGTNYGANGGGGNTGKWRGQKSSFLEGGIRVPAVISYPAKLGKDKKGQSLGNLSDPQPEKKNYIREKPDIAKRLQALHAEWLKEVEPKH